MDAVPEQFGPQAEVITAELLDRLVLVPRQGTSPHSLMSALRSVAPSLPVKRSTEGLSIPSESAHELLKADGAVRLLWRVDARLFAENRGFVRVVHSTLRDRVEAIKSGGVVAAKALLGDLDNSEVLDDHQLVNVAAMTLPECYGLCVFDEQGAGKTVTLIFAFDLLVARDVIDIVLVIAPKSMVSEWPADLFRFKGDLYRSAIVAGTYREKRKALATEADFFVTNFETAVAMESEILALLRRYRGRALLVVDESFYIKNLDAKRTRAIRRLREWCGRAYVLCGTPAPNSPHDLVEQFNVVDFGLTFAGVQVPDDPITARRVVQQAIQERGVFIRHLKQDVLPDLPGKTFHRVLVQLEPEQEQIYRTLLEDLIIEVRNVDEYHFQKELTSFLAKRNALLQVCSNPVAVVAEYQEVPAKLKALDEIVRELAERRCEKVVIWSFYTISLDAIFRRYAGLNPVRYDGSVTSVTKRRDAVRRFQEDDTTMLFIGNPAAAGAGLTLHRAKYAVYESLSNQAAHYLQSVDRLHRRGQERDVEYIMLQCDKTIEMKEYDRLANKEQAQHLLLGDEQSPPITRESMLEELLEAQRLLGMKE